MKQKERLIEIWRDVEDFEGCYQISSFGRVRSLDRMVDYGLNKAKKSSRSQSGRIMKPVILKGYLRVKLNKNDKGKVKFIHRLVAEAFIPNPDNKPQINHKDGNKKNNCVSNLEWATQKENTKHCVLNDLMHGKLNNLQRRVIMKCDLKQDDIAEIFGISQQRVSRLKQGHFSAAEYIEQKNKK